MSDEDPQVMAVLVALDYEDRAGDLAPQVAVLIEALLVYAERNDRYNDNWRPMGRRGVLFRIRERAERLWEQWNWDPATESAAEPATDDAIDLINFCAFLVRANRGETTRDGTWF